MKLPTMKVKKGDGFVLINERDFDPPRHVEFEEVEVVNLNAGVTQEAPMAKKRKPRKKGGGKYGS